MPRNTTPARIEILAVPSLSAGCYQVAAPVVLVPLDGLSREAWREAHRAARIALRAAAV